MGSIEEAGCEIKIPVTYRLQQTASVIHHLRPPREHHVCPGDQPIISSLVLFFSFVAVVVFLCLVRSLSFLYQSRVSVVARKRFPQAWATPTLIRINPDARLFPSTSGLSENALPSGWIGRVGRGNADTPNFTHVTHSTGNKLFLGKRLKPSAWTRTRSSDLSGLTRT